MLLAIYRYLNVLEMLLGPMLFAESSCFLHSKLLGLLLHFFFLAEAAVVS